MQQRDNGRVREYVVREIDALHVGQIAKCLSEQGDDLVTDGAVAQIEVFSESTTDEQPGTRVEALLQAGRDELGARAEGVAER